MKSELLHVALIASLTLLPFAPPASGQAAVPAETNVTVKIDIVAWGDPIQGLSITSGGKNLPVSALAFEYSKAVSYSGSNVLELSAGSAAPAGDSKKIPADSKSQLSELDKRRLKNPNLVALAILPTGSKRVTVLIAPAANGTYQTYVIDDDPAKLPPGKLRIHNYSPIPIAVRCNRKESHELKNKQSAVVSPEDGNVIYELAYLNDGKWKMQENNLIRVGDTDQVQMVVLKSEADFFTSGDGSRGGFLQIVTLRRSPKQQTDEVSGE